MFARYLTLIQELATPGFVVLAKSGSIHANPAGSQLLAQLRNAELALGLAGEVVEDGLARSFATDDHVWSLGPLFDERDHVEAVLAVELPLAELPRLLNRFAGPMRYFSRIVHELPQPVATARPNGTIDYLSRRWYEIAGQRIDWFEPAEAFLEAVVASDRGLALERWETGTSGVAPFSFEVRLKTQNGPRWHKIDAAPMFERRAIVKWVATINDVHDEAVALQTLGQLADTLQRAMLPTSLPERPWLHFDVTYVPATSETLVGGDWYDAFDLGDHRIAIVIGDVVGHGIDAAIAMGNIRHIVRAACHQDADPAYVLGYASRAMHAEHGPLATALFGVLDALTFDFTYGNAGHPPAYLVERGGALQTLVGTGVLLGAWNDPQVQSRSITLGEDCSLVLYTDGLIEATRDLAAGERALQIVLSKWGADGFQHSASELQRRVLDDGAAEDDVAMLIVTALPTAALDLTVSASPLNATRLRVPLRRFLAHHAVQEDQAYDLTLAVAEALNNAAEHAYRGAPGQIRLLARLHDETVEVVVSDLGTWSTYTHEDRGRGLGIMRGLVDDVRVAHGIDGTTVSLRSAIHAGVAASV